MEIKAIISIFLLFICAPILGQGMCGTTIGYGNNPEGQYAQINGIKMYFETYGDPSHQPLLIIHGNGGSIYSSRCQIEYFKDDYHIIVADSRFQGNSQFGDKELTYALMTEDYKQLLDYLKLDSVFLLGQSDGGIIGLLLAMKYPSKVKKVVSIAPNLRPDNCAIHQWDIDNLTLKLEKVESEIKKGDQSYYNIKRRALLNLMDKYPNVENEELAHIKSPVLVIAGDEDVIRLEHILEIYQNIPKAQLFIMPGATHFMIKQEHALLNQMVDRFLSNPFKRPTTKKMLSK